MHPYVIDTSFIFNLTGIRGVKTKLSIMTDIFLNRKIQDSSTGHNPIEDSRAAMELVQLKLKMGKEFGDVILNKTANSSLPDAERLFNLKFQQLNQLVSTFDITVSNVRYEFVIDVWIVITLVSRYEARHDCRRGIGLRSQLLSPPKTVHFFPNVRH